MKREQVIEWAREAHGPISQQWWDMDAAALERFAALVAASEREACAAAVQSIVGELGRIGASTAQIYGASIALEAIRARDCAGN